MDAAIISSSVTSCLPWNSKRSLKSLLNANYCNTSKHDCFWTCSTVEVLKKLFIRKVPQIPKLLPTKKSKKSGHPVRAKARSFCDKIQYLTHHSHMANFKVGLPNTSAYARLCCAPRCAADSESFTFRGVEFKVLSCSPSNGKFLTGDH